MPCCRAACLSILLLSAHLDSALAAPPGAESGPARPPGLVEPVPAGGQPIRLDIRPATNLPARLGPLSLASGPRQPTGEGGVGPAVAGAARGEPAASPFQVPPGFTWQLVAGPPLVSRPISADFDEQGRLYVTDSSGS
ncbi:MAG: hypothetical protein ACKO3P_07785, partial [Planctomycetaceae bacterium]